MSIRSIFDEPSRPHVARKFALLMIFAGLIAVVVAIMPHVATLAPAVHAKELMLRVLFLILFPPLLLSIRHLLFGAVTLIDVSFAALLAANVLSAILSPVAVYSFTQHWHLITVSAVGWAFYRLRPTRRELLVGLITVTSVGFMAAIYGFLTYRGFDPLQSFYPFQFDAEQAGGRNYIHSFFGNPEYFGGFAAPCAFISGLLVLYRPLPILCRAWCLVQSMVIVLVIALAGARMALLGIAFAGVVSAPVVYTTIPKLWHRWVNLGALAGLLVIVAGITILSTSNPLNPREVRLVQRFTTIMDLRSDSVRERIVFYTSTAEGIGQNFFFGYGPGTFRLEFFENLESLIDKDPRAGTSRLAVTLNNRLAEHAHNDYLEFWFETGTVGMAALLFVIALIVYYGFGLYCRGIGSPEDRLLATYFLGGSLCLLLNALSSFPFHMPARAYLAWFLIGGFFAAIPKNRELGGKDLGKSGNIIKTKE